LAGGYGGTPVAADIDFEVLRGAKVGIVGENGRGKTTLLRTLAGLLPSVSGSVKWWHRADIGYYSQQAEETVNPAETVLEALTRAAPPASPAERILATAGAFLFHDDDLEKPCGVLSGGERARVRLARLILHEHSVLLLDEPSNHLDAETVEVLARALKEYKGTVFIVSHARTFMNAIVERLYEVRNGTVRHYAGTYEDYVADLSAIAEETETLPGGPIEGAAAKREQALLAKERRRGRQKLEDKLKEMEHERGQILKYFFENPTDYSPEKSRRLAELEEMISVTENEWLKLAE
jgi:ATP-binding cassette subfamily F protein 3